MIKISYSILFLFAIVSAQPWINQSSPGMDEPPLQMPFDSSQIIAERITASKIPVLIDFWATWCGPCRMLNPIMEELKKKYAGKISFEKINVDAHRKISAYFQVSAIPAVFIVADKAVINYLPGLQPKETYEQALQAALKPANKKQQDASKTPASKSTSTPAQQE